MADAMDTLKNILGDDAEDKIKTVMNSLSSADNTSEGIDSSNGLNQIMQIKNIMDSMAVNKNDRLYPINRRFFIVSRICVRAENILLIRR